MRWTSARPGFFDIGLLDPLLAANGSHVAGSLTVNAGIAGTVAAPALTGKLPAWCGLLSPQGKALFDFIVWPAGRELLIDCEADAADGLVKRLTLYRLRRQITIARDDSVAVHWRPHVGDGAAPDPRLAALGQRWVAPIDPDDHGGDSESADAAWLAHRLALGVPEGRAELGDGDILWLETSAAELNGVSFTKGCYVGQENTARMNWRQKVNRRLLVVPLDRRCRIRHRAGHSGATVPQQVQHQRGPLA